MTYAFVQDVPANEEIYAQIRGQLGNETPAGLITHLAMKLDSGLRYVDVWESEAAWTTFRDERLEPVVGSVLASYGLPHDHSIVIFDTVDLIDVWVGQSVPA